MGKPIRAFLSCSYSPQDQATVAKLREMIEECGIELYVVSEAGGLGELSKAIIDAIQRSDLFIVIITPNLDSDAKQARPWLISEIGIASAFNKDIVLFRDEQVEQPNLGVALNLIAHQFTADNPLANRDPMVKSLEKAVKRAQATPRIVRESDLEERVLTITDNHRKEQIEVRELTVEKTKGKMDWPTFIRGYELLSQQFNEMQSRPIDLWVGVNATGTNIAAYLRGHMDVNKMLNIPFGTVHSTPEDLNSGARSFSVSLPPRRVLSSIDKQVKPRVVVVDSQLKTGRSQKKIQQMIEDHLGREIDVWHAALIANLIRSPDTRNLSTEDLISETYNSNNPRPTRPPNFLAYISETNIKPPEGLP